MRRTKHQSPSARGARAHGRFVAQAGEGLAFGERRPTDADPVGRASPRRGPVPPRRVALAIMAASGLCSAVEGPTQPQPPLGVEQCVTVALENSPRLRGAGAASDAAAEAVGQARASLYPTLGLRGAASRWQSHAFLPSGLAIPNLPSIVGPTDDWSAGGVARYTVFDGGARRAAIGLSEAGQAGAAHAVEVARREVVLGVHLAFCGLAAALEQQRVAQGSLSNSLVHIGLARQRQAAGAATGSDVLRAQVAAAEGGARVAQAAADVTVAAGTLNTAMGRPAEAPLTIQPLAADAGPTSNTVADTLAERPEVLAAVAGVAAARQRLEAARAAYRPKVAAEAAYGWRDDTVSLSDEAWSAGMTVEWTVFDGAARKRDVARREAELAEAEAVLAETRLAVQQDLWTARARVSEQRGIVEATATQVQDAREAVRLMAARYTAGAVSVSELLDAQTALTESEGSRVQARWRLAQAEARLHWACGGL